MSDHYATLGVSRQSDEVVIQAAYRALMRKYHPDTNATPSAARRAAAINEAYAVLGDRALRLVYDAAESAKLLPAIMLPPVQAPTRPVQNEVAIRKASAPRRRWGLQSALLFFLVSVALFVVALFRSTPASLPAVDIVAPGAALLPADQTTAPTGTADAQKDITTSSPATLADAETAQQLLSAVSGS